MSSLARRGQKFECTSHERLKEAFVVDRLVAEHGYCTVCANELLKYVGTLLSR